MLTIAVSTLKTARPAVLDKLSELSSKLPFEVKMMVISQMEDVNDRSEWRGITLIRSTEKGLSKSRNLALDNCVTDWVWFQDDDIVLLTENVAEMLGFLNEVSADIVLAKVGSLECPDSWFKDYSRFSVSRRFLAFRISSIEIVVRVSFVNENKLRFDEQLGLGTSFPSGEENLFFYECVVRHGAVHHVFDKKVCLHTTVQDKRSIDHMGRYRARGYMLGRINDIYSPIILLWWALRSGTDSVPRMRRLELMIRFYLKSAFGF